MYQYYIFRLCRKMLFLSETRQMFLAYRKVKCYDEYFHFVFKITL
jgi:hypothetical protein